MISFVRHKNIDKQKWDAVIVGSTSPRMYALSWYLDIVAPDWDALIEGDYQILMPLTQGPRFGIRYLRQPVFCQQLGIFSKQSISDEVVLTMLKHIPVKFKLAEICLNSRNNVSQSEKYIIEPLTNYFIDLSVDYDDLRKNYSYEIKRNLSNLAKCNLQIIEDIDINQMLDFVEKQDSESLKDKDKFRKFRSLCEVANNRGCLNIWGAFADNQLIFTIVMICSLGRYSILKICETDFAHQQNLFYAIIDEFLKIHSTEISLLEFVDSQNPTIINYCRQIGSVREYYFRYKINRLPIFIRHFS